MRKLKGSIWLRRFGGNRAKVERGALVHPELS
jgi:hypothetical protein